MAAICGCLTTPILTITARYVLSGKQIRARERKFSTRSAEQAREWLSAMVTSANPHARSGRARCPTIDEARPEQNAMMILRRRIRDIVGSVAQITRAGARG